MEMPVDDEQWDFVVRVEERMGKAGSRGLGFLLNPDVAVASVGPDLPTKVTVFPYSSQRPVPASVVAALTGNLAVLSLDTPMPSGRLGYDHGQAGEPFETVVVTDQGQVRVRGVLTDPETGRIDGGLPQIRFVRGAPVVQEGAVVGILTGMTKRGLRITPMVALVDRLDQWAPEVRDGLYPVERPLTLDDYSDACQHALGWFETLGRLSHPLPPQTAMWNAVLYIGQETASTFASVVAEHLTRAGYVITSPVPASTRYPDPLSLRPARPVLDAARAVRDRTSPGAPVHLRHLVAALVRSWPEPFEAMGGDADELRLALLDVVHHHLPDDDQDAWHEILGTNTPPSVGPGVGPPVRSRAGYDNDSADAISDELDVRGDVETLCDVLAAKEAMPPLAVGLFGQWGAGKSTFMNLMRDRMKVLASTAQTATEAGRDTAYCSDIVQIEFNAWHYMDANLWASLAVRIFQGLSTDDDVARDDTEAGALLARLHSREKQLAPVDAKISSAVQDERLDGIAATLGVEASRSELVKLLGEVRRSVRLVQPARLAVAAWLSPARRRRLVGMALAVAVVVPLAIFVVLRSVGVDGVAQAVVAALPALGVAGNAVRRAGSALKKGNEVFTSAGLTPTDVNERIEGDREVAAIKQRLAELDRRRGLYEFVLERAGSDDYRKHFGLISVVRDDFEKLATRLAVEAPGRRIILYVDDLDRCPPESVVEVLQAVHLLLAFRLFVVVVGVDPRWLLRSLERQYQSVLSNDDGKRTDDAFWASTPQNYLEKIFQIPFALRPMDYDGFGRLVSRMLSATDNGAVAEPSPAAAPKPPVRAPDRRSRRRTTPAALPAQAAVHAVESPAPPVPAPTDAAVPSTASVDPNPVALQVTDDERTFMHRVGGLVKTPREAKRLINLYRLVRASRAPDQVDQFVQDADYVPVITLLAVLVGFREQARDLFDALMSAPAGSWRALVESRAAAAQESGDDADEWRVLSAQLVALEAPGSPGLSLDRYRRWVPIVERYSFDTALAAVAPVPVATPVPKAAKKVARPTASKRRGPATGR